MTSRLFRIPVLFTAALLILCIAAFAEAGSLFDCRLLDDGSVMITGYRGSDPELVFPETIDGRTVSGVSEAFGTKTAYVKGIRKITIPDSVTEIEPGALRFAEYLTEISVPEDHPVLAFEDGVLYDRKEQRLLLYLQTNIAEHFDVPEGIRVIEDKAFVRARLHSVSLPGSVERIGRESFYQCTWMEEITLSEGLKTIGPDAFTNCDMLREIEIPASVDGIAESAFTDAHLKEIRVAPGSPVLAVSDGALIDTRSGTVIAFPPFSPAESCSVPEGVKRIGSFAFYRCHNLKKITLPDSLQEIGHGAFLMCNHLAVIDLPDSVAGLEELAFGINSHTEQLHISAGLTEIVNNFEDLGITELKIPETVTLIDKSFTTLPNLKEVMIPPSVTTIGERCFAFCKNLAGITIPASVTEIRTTFAGCADTLVISVEAGSYAEQYCREHDLNFEILSE